MNLSVFTSIIAAASLGEGAPATHEKRAEMTWAQNWAYTGGTFLSGVRQIAIGIGGASSFEMKGFDVPNLKLSLAENDFNMKEEHWHHDPEAGKLTYTEAIDLDNNLRFENLTFSKDGSLHSRITDLTEAPASLEKRVAYLHNKVDIQYYPTAQCYTTQPKSAMVGAVNSAITTLSNYYYEAGFYKFTTAGPWVGHLKVLEVTTGGLVAQQPYQETCG